MKITGVLVDMPLELDSETYSKHVLFKSLKKVIYIVLLIEIYGMFVSALFFYKNVFGDLGNIGF